MATRKKLSSPTLYSIAWIAALPIERAAAMAFLDNCHDEPEGFNQHVNDDNAYDWGEIGQHNVVIASLPAGVYGMTAAAITASHLLSSLSHIKICLLVGIGGGIPRPGRDIRLGDVVVSQPAGSSGGVVQYDLGKAKAGQTWELKGALNMPPMVLLNALGKLQASHEIEDPRITNLLQGLVSKYPRMKKTYGHQGEQNDRLFSLDYEHAGGSTCDACDSSQEEKRWKRETTDPEIHYGIVASGNTLVKNATFRDEIVQLVGEECLCVEMEAAGLMNTFPCLVIRGICDYADSHKNDHWQRYASATAAAFAVELLGCVRAKQLQDTPSAQELMKSIATFDDKITRLKESVDSSYSKIVLDRLPIAIGAAHDSSDSWLQATCLKNTRVDVLREIYEWADDPTSISIFWLNGMAGTGKSTISRTVAQRLAEAGTLGGSFFFKKGETERANPSKLFTTLAAGLSRWQPAVSRHIEEAIDQNPQIFDQMPYQQFAKLILEPLSRATLCSEKPVVIVIDALDECQHRSITSIITDIFPRARSLQHPRLKFFLTSRPELPIQAGFPSDDRRRTYQDMILQDVPYDVIKKDLETFLSTTVEAIRKHYNSGPSTLPPSWPGKDAIQRLLNMAMPLFIVASTVCRFLDDRRLGSPKRQMDKILGVQDRAHASTLDQMYLAILNQQFGDGPDSYTSQQKNEIVEEFRLMVGPIILLSTPLTIPALAQLLHSDQDISDFQETLENRLELLHSVLSVPQPSDRLRSPVRTLHLSFRDFLVDNKRRDANPFWVDEAKSHLFLAHSCLRVMRTSLRENMCELKHPGIQKTAICQETVNRGLPQHVRYACLHWIDHLEQTHIDSAIAEEILVFLENHLLHWLEALGLIGRVMESVVMVERLKRITTAIELPQLSEFLNDAIRFSGANAKVVALAPLQIYSSALIFAPLRSVVRTTFHMHIPEWISTPPRVEEEWSHCLHTLKSSNRLDCITFSPDSKLIAGVTNAGEVWIWDVKTGTELQAPTKADDTPFLRAFKSIAFSADSTLVFITSADGIRVYRVLTGKCIQKLQHPQSSVRSMSPLAPNLIASGSRVGEIRIWEVETGRLVSELEGHQEAVWKLVVSADQRLLASGSEGTIIIWQTGTWTRLQTLKVPGGSEVFSIAISSDSALVAAAIYNTVKVADSLDTIGQWNERGGGIAIFAAKSGRLLRTLPTCPHFPVLMFRSGSVLVVSEGQGAAISLWQADTGHCYLTRGKLEHATTTVLSGDSTLAIYGSRNGLSRILDVNTGKCLQLLDELNPFKVIEQVAMSADRRSVATYAGQGNIKVWQVSLNKDSCQEDNAGVAGPHQATSSDFRLVALRHFRSSTLKIVETTTEKCLHQLHGEDSLDSVVFSPDSKRVLAVGKKVLIWDTETGIRLLELERPPQSYFYAATFSSTSELVATACSKRIQVCRVSTGECIQDIKADTSYYYGVLIAFSPDSTWLVVSRNKAVETWEISSGQLLLTIKTSGWKTTSVAISTDKKLIAMASENGMVEVWKTSTGDCVGTFNPVAKSASSRLLGRRSRTELEGPSTELTGPGHVTPRVRLSFEAGDTQLLTSSGLIGLNMACSPELGATNCLQNGKVRIGIGVSADRQWITWYGHPLLLIPIEYRGNPVDVQGLSVLLQSNSEKLAVITFNSCDLTSIYTGCT